jgi:2-polyprenyl-3-methyl-5-hydroxy-6-metoxy-1,4-benzoquinol methylase
MTEAPYFENHRRRDRFPWSLYHRDLSARLVRTLGAYGAAPRVLVVGCGLEPEIDGAPEGTLFHGCDLDARAIAECARQNPRLAERLAVCPSPNELPSTGKFAAPFDVVLAKEVVEHLPDPAPWARLLASRVRVGGALVLTTPNYSRLSTLPYLEATVLEWIARRDGYSRKHIHPSKFSRRSLRKLDVGPGMKLARVEVAWTGWTLLGVWLREADVVPSARPG